MVDRIAIGGLVLFGLLFGSFLGFVLSKGELTFALVGAVVLTAVLLVYQFTLGVSMEDDDDDRASTHASGGS